MKKQKNVSNKTIVGLVFTILFFFIILSIEVPYYAYGFKTSSILIIIGLLIYTIGAIVSRLSYKWIPIHLQLITNLITFIIIIIAYAIAPVLIKITPAKKCELINKKDNIYYYCVSSIKKAVSQNKYKEITEIKNFKPLENESTLVIAYEDGSNIYEYDNLRILECSSGSTIYGDLFLTYHEGFCGTTNIPNIKTKSK